jgi:hypothetical protein
VGKPFVIMEEQVPPSQPAYQTPLEGQITQEQLAEMKARARELAIQQTLAAQATRYTAPPQPEPRVIYVRRNLTVAELLVVFLISCGIVTGIQGLWYLGTKVIPNIEFRIKS